MQMFSFGNMSYFQRLFEKVTNCRWMIRKVNFEFAPTMKYWTTSIYFHCKGFINISLESVNTTTIKDLYHFFTTLNSIIWIFSRQCQTEKTERHDFPLYHYSTNITIVLSIYFECILIATKFSENVYFAQDAKEDIWWNGIDNHTAVYIRFLSRNSCKTSMK